VGCLWSYCGALNVSEGFCYSSGEFFA